MKLLVALVLLTIFSTASACECTDFALELKDSTGEGCDAYEGKPGLCGLYDTDLFYANVWCCACGGGLKFDELDKQPALPQRPQHSNPRLISRAKKDERRQHDEEKLVIGHQIQEKDQLEGESHHLTSDCLKVERVLEYVAIVYPSLVELDEAEKIQALHDFAVRYIQKHLEGHPTERRVLSQKDERRRLQCVDSDLYYGWTDSYGDGCDWYYGNEEWCGYYDDGDFWAYTDCCACGGGMFNYW